MIVEETIVVVYWFGLYSLCSEALKLSGLNGNQQIIFLIIISIISGFILNKYYPNRDSNAEIEAVNCKSIQ